MAKKRVLLICGSLNQTTINYQVAQNLRDYECCYTPYFSDGLVGHMSQAGLLEFSILGRKARHRTEAFLTAKGCTIDHAGMQDGYDLVVTCSDLVVPKSIREERIILIQEGITDPENYRYHFVRQLGLPRYPANTSMTGLSDAYEDFCVASSGYRDLFVGKGISPDKIVVTGIPNFDNVEQYFDNDFPYQGYILAATSHLRETYKYENRKKFIRKALDIADGRQVIFKLHPSENHQRAIRELERYAPGSLVFTDGNTNHMIANSDALVTKYSSVILVALAMGKRVYSDLSEEELEALRPLQNGGTSAQRIADVCRRLLA